MDGSLPGVIQRWGMLGKTAIGASLAIVLAVCFLLPYAHAQEKQPTNNPVGNCFDGTFAADPVHCHAFEQAYAAGKLDIEAMYQGGGALFVYLRGSDPVADDVYDFLHNKALEEARRTGEHPCFLEEDGCSNAALKKSLFYVLPESQSYEYIFLRPGGEEALRAEHGWPAYIKLWPAGGGARSASNTIDTSQVDTTNFPPLDCQTQVNSVVFSGCLTWEDHPGLGIAGLNYTPNHGYFQVKVRPGHEEADVAAALAELHRRYPGFQDDGIVVIPVKYDYEELWRYSLLLARFAKTPGNTLGITGAGLGENWESYKGHDAVFPPEGPPEVARENLIQNYRRYRTTIHIRTLELDRTVDALPQLLAQLNIPADTVGVVSRVDRTPGGRVKLADANGLVSPSTGNSVGNSSDRWENAGWLAAAVAIAVLAVALLLVRRMRQPT